MAKLVQCVPNFSEGKRREVVEKIVGAIRSARGVKVLDYSMDVDHNRSVVTFVGEPEAVRESVLAGARVAVELIDLNKHKGGHPRIGAVDVIPVVPIHELTMADAIALSYEIGKEIADQLHVPVYFYDRSAVMRHRTSLALIRKGGYETLKETGLINGREPDLGPAALHPTAGATVVGARGPLIAYNVNLATEDVHIARRIAANMRKVRDSGKGLAGVKAIGVYLKSRNLAQVSTNITQPHQTGIYEVYAFVEKEARAMGVDVLESELIGALREEAILDVVKSAIKMGNLSRDRILDHWI